MAKACYLLVAYYGIRDVWRCAIHIEYAETDSAQKRIELAHRLIRKHMPNACVGGSVTLCVGDVHFALTHVDPATVPPGAIVCLGVARAHNESD